MNPIKNAPGPLLPHGPIANADQIRAAHVRAALNEDPSINIVSGEEMRAVIDVARRDDGQVSRDEAIFIGQMTRRTFIGHSAEANAEVQKLLAAHQIDIEDLWS